MISYFTKITTEKDMPYILFYDMGKESVLNHWHKEIELVLCREGSVEMTVNNQKVILQPNEIGVAVGGDIHSYGISEGHKRTVIIFDLAMFEIYLNPASANMQTLRQRLGSMDRFSPFWSEESRVKALNIINRLEELNSSDEFGRNIEIMARLCDLVLLFCNGVPHDFNTAGAISNFNQIKLLESLEKAFTYVELHYKEHIKLEDVAKIMNFNTSYFARFFHKVTGVTFMNHLADYRINKACGLLKVSGKTVSEISAAVGFESTKTFNRVFKKTMGISPTEYKKKNL